MLIRFLSKLYKMETIQKIKKSKLFKLNKKMQNNNSKIKKLIIITLNKQIIQFKS